MKKKKKKSENKELMEIITFIVVIIAGIMLILTFILTFNLGGKSKQIKCKEIYGHWCNDYELSKMEEK